MEPDATARRNHHPLLRLFAGPPPASTGSASATVASLPSGRDTGADRSPPSHRNQPPVPPAGHDGAQPEANHHMKNSLELVASMLALQARRTVDTSTSHVLDDVHDRLLGLATLYEQIDRCRDQDHVDLGTFLRDLALALNRPEHTTSLVLDAGPIPVPPMAALKFGLLVCELAAHASRAAGPSAAPGAIRVRLERSGEGCRLTLADDGARLAASLGGENPGGFAHVLLHSALAQLAATMTIVKGNGSTIVIDVPSLRLASNAQGETPGPSNGRR